MWLINAPGESLSWGNKVSRGALISLIMKKIITLLAVAASLAVLTPTTSQARDDHRSSSRSFSHSCGSCRAPVYRERVCTGHDRHGRAIYGYRTSIHSCRSSHGHGHSSHGHSSHGHNSNRGRFSLPGFLFGFGR